VRPPREITHKFVEFIPAELTKDTLYISIEYATASHSCFCGCGNKVVTPLSPTDWRLIFDGRTVSLEPSIGNWSFDCQSHYWIEQDQVIWLGRWSRERIDANRARARRAKQQYYETGVSPPVQPDGRAQTPAWPRKLLERLRRAVARSRRD
jgi:hypothetical protein